MHVKNTYAEKQTRSEKKKTYNNSISAQCVTK